MMRVLTFIAGSMIPATQPCFAQTIEFEISNHPNPSVVAFYQSNSDQIAELLVAVNDSGQGDEARLSAFSQLALEYPIAAEIAARELVADDATPVAWQAVQYLIGEVVMSDHDMSQGTEGFSPLVRYTMMSHMASRSALRDTVTDPRPELRDVVAPFLSSLSDMEALEAITESPELYSDAEAAVLITLSSSEDSLALLEQYISSDDTTAQAASVEYLAAFPQFQDRIRSKVFLNSAVDDTVRSVAGESLSLYDNKFANYALIVAGEQDVSPDLYRSAISGYVEQSLKDGLLRPKAAGNFANQIDNYIGSIDDTLSYSDAIDEIQLIKQRLETIYVNQR